MDTPIIRLLIEVNNYEVDMELKKDDYYKAMELFHLAKEALNRFQGYEAALNKLLDNEQDSHASDTTYCNEDLNSVLKRMGITVEDN